MHGDLFLATGTQTQGRASLAIDRDVAAASGAVFLIGLGEELWKKFLPKYLESLGASVAVVGFFGTAEDFFDALYQYPGGWLADRWGRRRAFLAFLFAAVSGYLVYLFSPSWPILFGGIKFDHGVAVHGVTGDFRDDGRRAPRGAAREGLQPFFT